MAVNNVEQTRVSRATKAQGTLWTGTACSGCSVTGLQQRQPQTADASAARQSSASWQMPLHAKAVIEKTTARTKVFQMELCLIGKKRTRYGARSQYAVSVSVSVLPGKSAVIRIACRNHSLNDGPGCLITPSCYNNRRPGFAMVAARKAISCQLYHAAVFLFQ